MHATVTYSSFEVTSSEKTGPDKADSFCPGISVGLEKEFTAGDGTKHILG